jgi:hypothetical protein
VNGATAIGAVLMVAMAAAAVLNGWRRESLGASAAAEFAAMLRHRVIAHAMMAHLPKLQEIANVNDGNRPLGTRLRRQRRLSLRRRGCGV